MSRSGYTDDLDALDLGRWRAIIRSATKGKRGQAFFRELVEALDAMPVKELISDELDNQEGCMCTLGALAKHKGVDLDSLDTYDYEQLGKTFNIAEQLAQEVMNENDDGWHAETPADRWKRMRKWAEMQIHSAGVEVREVE